VGTTHPVPHPFLVPLLPLSILNITLKSNGNEFGVVFLVMWGGSFVVTINTKLLGGKISFFQCVCVLGYCVFPIVLGAILVAILRIFHADFLILKLILAVVCLVWAAMSTSCG
jgi:protein YIPF6